MWYGSPDELLTSTLEFIRAGLAAGEAVLVASAGPYLQRLRLQVGAGGDRVTWTGMSGAAINPRRITAAMRGFADEHRGRPVRLVQEPAWHLCPPDQLCEAIRHETLVNLALGGSPVTVLCAFDQQLASEAVAAVTDTHPLIVRDKRWLPSPSFAADLPVPRECDQPLPSPPAGAAMLTYRHDQAGVRQFTAQQARLAGLPPERVTDLVIAVGEVAANTLAHTDGPGRLWLWSADGVVFCQIHDSGELSDPLAGSFLPDPGALGGGRGLWVVNQLCDLVEIRTGPAGTTVRLRVNLAPEAPPAARRRRASSTSCR